MTKERWELFLDSAYNTASMTSLDEPHVIETRRGIEEASKGWNKNGKVLVLGCGDGLELRHFRDLGFTDVTGVTRHPDEFDGFGKLYKTGDGDTGITSNPSIGPCC